MNRRMGKRSRLLTAASVPDLSVIAGASKDSALARGLKHTRVGDVPPALSTVFNADLHASPFQTSLTSALPSGNTSSGFSRHRPASSFSPLPLTKPVPNSGAKENVVTSQPQTDLTSLFNGRPSCRNVSPAESRPEPRSTKRPRRTLSTHTPGNRELIAPATDAAPPPDRKKAKTLHHGRNPSLPSFVVNDSPEWLNYAEAKPRKPVRGRHRRVVRGSENEIDKFSGVKTHLKLGKRRQ
jgi:hypothetical protein